MTRYFLISANRDQAMQGVKEGYAQARFGRKNYMTIPAKGDWVVYYAAKDKSENGINSQKFCALGQVADDEPWQTEELKNTRQYRRQVTFENLPETAIRPLIQNLSFIKNKRKWAFYLIIGFQEISKEDFTVIRQSMLWYV